MQVTTIGLDLGKRVFQVHADPVALDDGRERGDVRLEVVGRADDQQAGAGRAGAEQERRVPGDDAVAELVVDPLRPHDSR